MKRITMLGAILAAALLATAALASSAFAAVPENLPFSANTRNFTGKQTALNPTLNSAADVVVCETATGEGTEEPGKAGVAPHGTFHIAFAKCKEKAFGQACKGGDEGDGAGIILTLGHWKLVWDRKIGGTFEELTVATVFEINPLTFECTALAKIKVEGTQVCLDLEATRLGTTHEFHCVPKAKESAEQSEEYCEEESASVCTSTLGWRVPTLNASLNGAAAKPAAEEALGNTVFVEEIAADKL